MQWNIGQLIVYVAETREIAALKGKDVCWAQLVVGQAHDIANSHILPELLHKLALDNAVNVLVARVQAVNSVALRLRTAASGSPSSNMAICSSSRWTQRGITRGLLLCTLNSKMPAMASLAEMTRASLYLVHLVGRLVVHLSYIQTLQNMTSNL